MRPDEGMGPTFLLYHDLTEATRGDVKQARSNFERQVTTIAEAGYRFARMSQFVAGEPLDRRDVIITVDDGVRTFIPCMMPILGDLGASATMYLLTGVMGQRRRDAEFLSWNDVDDLLAQGIEFGSHGVSHVPFNEVEPERMRYEIHESTEQLRAHGVPIQTLAYPDGRYDELTKQTVAEAGYSAAFTVMMGGYDRFEIRRRLLTGAEGATSTRFVLSQGFFTARETVRSVVPRRLLKQELPIPPERWGAEQWGPEI